MKKTKIPRKKVRGKNMKRLFACLLSLSMISEWGSGICSTGAKCINKSCEDRRTTGNKDN